MQIRRWDRAILGVIAVILALPAEAAKSPSCAPPVEAAGVRVVRVERNGALVLEDGRAVRLEGLLLPAGARDRAPQYLADQAISVLSDLVGGRNVIIHAQRPKEDRYGRLRGQVTIDDAVAEPWLQTAMLRRGLARVSIAPDRRECVAELYAAENGARQARNGVWSQSAYAVRAATADFSRDADTFAVVQGKILSAAVRRDHGYLDFGADWRRDFTATISPEDLKAFRQAGVDPLSYEGKTVRVRGWVQAGRHPEIEVAGPEDIEVLESGGPDKEEGPERAPTLRHAIR